MSPPPTNWSVLPREPNHRSAPLAIKPIHCCIERERHGDRAQPHQEIERFRRTGAAIALLAAGALVLSACTSHNSETYSGAAAVNCGGKQSITASGSTAQANAMTLFISAFQKACQGQTLTYTVQRLRRWHQRLHHP